MSRWSAPVDDIPGDRTLLAAKGLVMIRDTPIPYFERVATISNRPECRLVVVSYPLRPSQSMKMSRGQLLLTHGRNGRAGIGFAW